MISTDGLPVQLKIIDMFAPKSFYSKVVSSLIISLSFISLSYSQKPPDSKPETTVTPGTNAAVTDDSAKALAALKKEEATKTKSNRPITVNKVYNISNKGSITGMAGIGDIIIVEVNNLDSLLNKAKAQDQKIRLFIDGRKIDSIEPISGAPDTAIGILQYRLDRNSSNDRIWADILGAPPLSALFTKPVKVSVGLDNEYAIKTLGSSTNFTLIRIHRGWFWACSILVFLYLYVFIVMVKRKGLLRDRSIDLSAVGIKNDSIVNPYSLGRFQMAFWFTLTIISFFFIWLITDAYDIITTTVLALIGISAGTSLSAAVIDDSKSTDMLNQTITLQDELAGLNNKISSLNSQITAVPAPTDDSLIELKGQLNTATARVDVITPLISRNKAALTPQKSDGFLNDILKDINGISFHRLQMFVWTLVLGLIFLYGVWKRLSMPEFGATLLALQGITAGTYLGFKFPEKQA
jgi:hypothetical protein